ncbi:MAG TPA: hypothetical protein VLG28_01905 [Acidimicrobiia bacterium]|jgi:hypothetical protein|nr:hypothetical protein [Acidimicrobiia bacterium]
MKRVLVVLALVAAFAMVAGAAYAAEEDMPAEVTIESHSRYGELWASGSGAATLDARVARLAMRVDGDVAIEGGVHRLVIDGRESALAEGGGGTQLHLDDFSGTIVVAGANFTVAIEGEVSLHGMGRGHASFRGEGWWKTLHHRGLWSGSDPVTALLPIA